MRDRNQVAANSSLFNVARAEGRHDQYGQGWVCQLVNGLKSSTVLDVGVTRSVCGRVRTAREDRTDWKKRDSRVVFGKKWLLTRNTKARKR